MKKHIGPFDSNVGIFHGFTETPLLLAPSSSSVSAIPRQQDLVSRSSPPHTHQSRQPPRSPPSLAFPHLRVAVQFAHHILFLFPTAHHPRASYCCHSLNKGLLLCVSSIDATSHAQFPTRHPTRSPLPPLHHGRNKRPRRRQCLSPGCQQ